MQNAIAKANAWTSTITDSTSALEAVQSGQTYNYQEPPNTTYEDVEELDIELESGLSLESHDLNMPSSKYKSTQSADQPWYNFLQEEYSYPKWENMQNLEVEEIVSPIFRVWR